MSPEPRQWRNRRSGREIWPEEESDLARRIASQQGLPEGVWGFAAAAAMAGPRWRTEEEAAVQVVSEPELVLRWMSVAVVVVSG
ncbi:unnamed protein product [Camellia sinensis]